MRIPVASVEAVAPESGEVSNWRDHYRRLLQQLDEPLIDYKVNRCPDARYVQGGARFMPPSRAVGTDYRYAVEQAIRHRRPVAVMIDEAQHLGKIGSGRRLLDQLDVIKSIANQTNTVHVLFGNEDTGVCGKSRKKGIPKERSTTDQGNAYNRRERWAGAGFRKSPPGGRIIKRAECAGNMNLFGPPPRQETYMNSRAKFVVVMSSTCLVALLLLGGVVSKGAAADENAAADTNVYKHLAVYSEVLSRIKSEYVEEPDMSSVTLGALNGLLESIDPYASYLNATQYKDYLKNFDTYRGDVGMVLSKKFGYINVVSVIPGSPAAKAGLTTGDMLESIKGIATRDMPLAYAKLLLKGEPGSTVDLSVLRRKPEPQKLTLTRAVIAVPPVESKLMPDSIGYIKVAAIGQSTGQEVSERDRRSAEAGREEVDSGFALLRIGRAGAGRRFGESFSRQGPDHVHLRARNRRERISPRIRRRTLPRCRWSCMTESGHGLGSRSRGGRAAERQAGRAGGRTNVRRCLGAAPDHDGRRQRDHSVGGKVLLARWKVDSGQRSDAGRCRARGRTSRPGGPRRFRYRTGERRGTGY